LGFGSGKQELPAEEATFQACLGSLFLLIIFR
jgi:hypothetical protein